MVSLPSRAATICEPHWLQKYRVLPGEDSKPLSRSSPLIQLKRSRGTLVTVENADPCVLRQVRQLAMNDRPGLGVDFVRHASAQAVSSQHGVPRIES
jgi:hypothetical protein